MTLNIIYIKNEELGSQNGTLGDTTLNVLNIRMNIIQRDTANGPISMNK